MSRLNIPGSATPTVTILATIPIGIAQIYSAMNAPAPTATITSAEQHNGHLLIIRTTIPTA